MMGRQHQQLDRRNFGSSGSDNFAQHSAKAARRPPHINSNTLVTFCIEAAMHALHARHHCSSLLASAAKAPARPCLRVQSLKRRDLFVGTVSLLSASDAVASETEAAAQQEAAAAAAAADGSQPAAAAASAPAAKKPAKKKKKRPAAQPKPKAGLKPPGVVPRVKLADNLSVSKVCSHRCSSV